MANGDDGNGGLVLGLGCERGACFAEVLALALNTLADAGFPGRPLLMIASLDARAEEPAIRATAAHFGVPFVTFDALRLDAETPRLATPSDVVFRHTGCHGVAEGAALAAGGPDGVLIVPKRVSRQATAAVVMASFSRCAETESVQPVAAILCHIESGSSQIDSSPAGRAS